MTMNNVHQDCVITYIYDHILYKLLLPERIISTRLRIRSICFRAAMRPFRINILKYSNISEPRPPITSTNSGVSLNGDVSNPKFRGDVDRMNPKSMWIK
jgi:hypothetical protein